MKCLASSEGCGTRLRGLYVQPQSFSRNWRYKKNRQIGAAFSWTFDRRRLCRCSKESEFEESTQAEKKSNPFVVAERRIASQAAIAVAALGFVDAGYATG